MGDLIKVAILASGNGSNAENIMKSSKFLSEKFRVECLISDQENAFVLERMKKFNIDSFCLDANNLSRNEHEQSILNVLQRYNVEWIFLAGYMRILSKEFLENFYDKELGQSRVVNIHPSYLPKFRGLNAYQRAFDKKESSGVTIHFVDKGVDSGRYILQRSFPYLKSDSFEDYKKRGMALEHQIYSEFLELFALGKLGRIHATD